MSAEEDFIEEEAEEESGDDGSSDESDEEEEGDDDSLIDDKPEEENTQTKKRGKRHTRIDDRLEDDDFELIRENTGIEVPKNKYRRIQRFDSDEEDDSSSKDKASSSQGVQFDKQRQALPLDEVFGGSDDEEDGTPDTSLMKDPFLDDDDEDVESPAARHEKQYGDDELDDFIDDGMPVSAAKSGVYTEPALLEALDVFGEFNPAEFGIGSDEEEDEDEIDQYGEEEDEYGGGRPQKLKKKIKKSIYDVYEPSELERGHFTEADTIIRITDVPERFQLRSIPVQNTEEGELEREADWVYHQAFCNPPISRQPHYGSKYGQRAGVSANMKPQSAIPKIKEALNLMRNHFFEVPYISSYRQEYIEPELDQNDLWKILQWDEKWMELQQRKQSLRKLFVRMQQWQFEKVRVEPDKALTEDYRSLEEEDLQRLEAVQTEDELSDVYQHFMLYYGRDVIAMKNKKVSQMNEEQPPLEDEEAVEKEKKKTSVKHARRRDFYSICQEAGLGSLASKFGLTAEQFGENLRDNYQRHETEQHPTEPEETAQEFIQPSGIFTSVRSILQGACHMVAMQIAYEPLVRQALRQVFSTRAVVNVLPTKKGKKMIDENHSCCSYKYLKNKPVREFRGDEFLQLAQAEKDGLLSIKITIDIEHSSDNKRSQGSSVQTSTYFEEIRMLFYRDEFSMLVEKWNAQRAQAMAHVLLKVLYPQMEKEIQTKLIQEAKEYVIESCVHQFRKWLNTGPYVVKDGLEDSEVGPRVMACTFSDDLNTAGYCCFLDGNGDVNDYLKLSCVRIRRNSYSEAERAQKEEELQRIKNTIKKRRPDIIVISAESRDAFAVMDDFKSCLSEMEFDPDSTPPPVELIDPSVARIFSKSYRSKDMFPNHPELLCQAASLARRVHEPLIEFTPLFLAQEDEVLALRMHVLQSTVSQDALKQALEAELVTKVNEVGVDINYCLEHPHAESLIPFVSGFGPRKANALLKTLRQESIQIQNRSQLVTQCSIGPQVFINCAGFIKINMAAFVLSDTSSVEVLDSTRVHPETYAWATKMAVDALEYDDEIYNQDADASAPVEEIMKKPDKLHDLDLDAFAVELQRRGCGNKRSTLYNIRDELFAPFKDRRTPFTSMSSEDKFTLLTGETPESLHEGKLVTCTVTGIARRRPNQMARERANPIKNQVTGLWQCPFCLQSNFHDVSMVWSHIDDGSCPGQGIGVRTRLENGLSGFVLTKNLSDRQVTSPEERVKVGMTIHCRILSVNIDKFSVDLSCRSSDLADKQGRFGIQKDMYYNHTLADAEKKREEEALQHKPKQRFMKRVIVHPSFHNITFSEADKFLASAEQGEGIFRPSSQGHDRLTLTWKVTDKVLQHVDIKEEGKPNPYSLGKSLLIGDEEYEDLDEILARFVQPMAANAREMMAHKSYREAHGGDKKYLERYLSEEKTKNPKRIPYFFSASSQYPGKFILAYQPGMRSKLELITIVPEGFRYRGQVQGSVTQLINWFKGHFKDPIRIPKPHPSQQLRPGSDHGSSVHGSSGTPYMGRSYQPGQTPYTPSQWMYHTPSSVTGSTNPHWSYRPTPPRDSSN